MLVCNVNVFCKTLKTSNFRNCLQPVMRYGKFRGNFQKWRQFSQCVYIQSFRVTKNHSHKKATKTSDTPVSEVFACAYSTMLNEDHKVQSANIG